VPVPSQHKVGGLQQERHPAYKWGDDGGGSLISPDGVTPNWIVGVSASFIFPCTIKSRRFLLVPAHLGTVLFCSLAVLDLRVGYNMDVLSPFISILCHSDRLFHRESCPRLDVIYPGRAWSSSPACTWHCSLHYFFLQGIPLFPHGMTTAC